MTNEATSTNPLLQPVNTATFDLDAWIDGTCGITTTAKIYQRGDLLPEIERLQRELEIAKEIPKDQRGVTDVGPDAIEERYAEVAQQWADSAITVYIQDRTEERRRNIRNTVLKPLKLDPEKDKVPVDVQDTIILNWIADAIVKVEQGGAVKDLPDGFPVNKLRALRDRLGDSGLVEVRDAFFRVISDAPSVAAPLSRTSSSDRGGIT